MGGASAGLKRDIFDDVDSSKSFGFKYPFRSGFGVGSLTNQLSRLPNVRSLATIGGK